VTGSSAVTPSAQLGKQAIPHSSVPSGHTQAPLSKQSAPAGQQFEPQTILGGSQEDDTGAEAGVGVLVGAAGGGWTEPELGGALLGVASQVPSWPESAFASDPKTDSEQVDTSDSDTPTRESKLLSAIAARSSTAGPWACPTTEAAACPCNVSDPVSMAPSSPMSIISVPDTAVPVSSDEVSVIE
jgi:hypothetical protein